MYKFMQYLPDPCLFDFALQHEGILQIPLLISKSGGWSSTVIYHDLRPRVCALTFFPLLSLALATNAITTGPWGKVKTTMV